MKMAPKRTSLVWNFFKKMSAELAVCMVCKKEIKHHSSTTNLKDHIQRKHPECLTLKIKDDGSETVIIDPNTSIIPSQLDSVEDSGERHSDGDSILSNVQDGKLVYQKLVVPMSMRSVYWKCFGFPANSEGEILTKVKIVCLLCRSIISYNKNTSNLRMHLQNKHLSELQQLELAAPPKKVRESPTNEAKVRQRKPVGNLYATDINGTLVINNSSNESAHTSISNIMEDYNATVQLASTEGDHLKLIKKSKEDAGSSSKSHVTLMVPGVENQSCTIESLHPFMIPVDSKSVCDAIAEFVVIDMQMPDIVEGRGFQRLIATLKSPCEIPSKSKLVDEVIPTYYDKYKESLQETLQHLKTDVALTVEEWESSTGESYVTLSVCYQQENDHNFISRVLSTIHCPPMGETSYWSLIFENLLEEWNIKEEKVKAVVCGSCRPDIVNSISAKGIVILPCLIQTLQEVCTRVCFEQDDVREILAKCRAYIYTVYNHNNALAALRIQDHLMSLEETPLTCDYPRVWVSTYVMLENFLSRRQVISSILDNVDSTTFDRDAITLTDHDWCLVEDVVNVLEPFKVTVMTLSEEKAPLVSLIKPLLWQLLYSHLKEKPEDSVNAQVFKGALKTLLSEKYNEPIIEQLLQTATTLDPRFKTLPNTADDCRHCLNGPIKEALVALIEKTPEESKPTQENTPEKKKPRLSGMMMLLGEVNTVTTSEMSSGDRASLEVIQYQSEPTPSLDQCPLTWWDKVSSKCPWLSRLAGQYMCIPATAIPPARIPTEQQVSYDIRRSNLTPEVVDRLIFLNSSH